MKLQHFFTINLVIAVFFGISCSVFPVWVLSIYGLSPNSAAIWTTRLVGGSILGFASLMWFGQKAATRQARRAIAFALLVQDSIGLVASLEIQLGGSVNELGWSNPSLYGLLVLAYIYYLYLRPGES
jgi:hypothetical protein